MSTVGDTKVWVRVSVLTLTLTELWTYRGDLGQLCPAAVSCTPDGGQVQWEG